MKGVASITMNLEANLKQKCNGDISKCDDKTLYYALSEIVKELAQDKAKHSSKKKLYYISAEFLIGKLLSNNLINLGIYDEVKSILSKNNKDICKIEELENEPSLGNGGLGRLAACFLDSIATLGLNGDGVGLNYHFGLFRQKFVDNSQTELPDQWLEENSCLTKTDKTFEVKFKDFGVKAIMYDIDVTGYNNHTNKLHLFDIETVDESIIKEGISFDKSDVKKNLTLFLYPDDSDEAGRLLRIYQQYFMVSCAAQLIIDECLQKGSNLSDLHEYAVIQINDTHPSMVIPELIRILMDKGIEPDRAIDTVSKCCAYTNHTILSEALEKWPVESLKKVSPQIVSIIELIDDKVRRKYTDSSLYVIDENELVHMAKMDIHCGFSVNGVASLHTEILKNNELNNFYKIYPHKFNNKTNGITFRRWLMHCNPELCNFITSLIGEGHKTNAMELEKLSQFYDDENVLNKLVEIKRLNKGTLKEYLKNTQNMALNENSIFDIQIKRLHEYKRQQMNALYVIHKYLKIKSGDIPATPITVIFGAKAARAYTIAQDIIHLILCLSQIINNDSEVNKHLNVFMVENYNVTNAQMLIPACDISEQISLASKEASGTGNMKLMLNGAITLGTLDGANVEIHQLVGDENIYIFGDRSETVIDRYKNNSYNPKGYYEGDTKTKQAIDFITSEDMLRVGNKEKLERLKNELINKDYFMTLPDFEDYIGTRERAYEDFRDTKVWARKMLVNISKAGYFSSDRTIEEYNNDIWHL